jgi:hypothetical protein
MKRKILLTFAAVLVIAAMLAYLVRPVGSFEEQIVRMEAALSCTLKDEIVQSARVDVLAICAKYGDKGYRIAERYPDKAPRLFALYGDLAEWQFILDRYGHQVVPVVDYFVERGSKEFRMRQALGHALRSFAQGERAVPAEDITPEQFGYIAILEIAENGHNFLGQFESLDGEVRRLPLERLLATSKGFLLGGILRLERVLTRGERWPTFGEIGFAALDVAVVAGGIAALSRLRHAATAARGTAATRLGRVSKLRVTAPAAAGSFLAAGRKILPAAAAVGAVYIAVRHPSLVTGAGRWLAEQANLPAWLGAFGAWALLLTPIVILLWPLFFVTRVTTRAAVRTAQLVRRLGTMQPRGVA